MKHHLYGVLANHEQVERELTPIPGGCPIPHACTAKVLSIASILHIGAKAKDILVWYS